MFVCSSSLLNSPSKIQMKFEAQGLQTWSFTRRFIPNFYLETGSLPDYANSYFWPAISISDTNNACGNCWNSAASKHLEKYCSNWKCFVQPNVLIVDKAWITPRNSKLLWVEPCEGRMLSGTLMRNKYWGIKMFILDTGNALGILYSLCLNSFPPTPVKWRSNTDEWCYIDGYNKSRERRCLGNLQALSSERYSWLWMRGWFYGKSGLVAHFVFASLGFLVANGNWIAAAPVEIDFQSSLKAFGSICTKHVYLWLAIATSPISTSSGSPGAEWQQPCVLLVALGSSLGFGLGNNLMLYK